MDRVRKMTQHLAPSFSWVPRAAADNHPSSEFTHEITANLGLDLPGRPLSHLRRINTEGMCVPTSLTANQPRARSQHQMLCHRAGQQITAQSSNWMVRTAQSLCLDASLVHLAPVILKKWQLMLMVLICQRIRTRTIPLKICTRFNWSPQFQFQLELELWYFAGHRCNLLFWISHSPLGAKATRLSA